MDKNTLMDKVRDAAGNSDVFVLEPWMGNTDNTTWVKLNDVVQQVPDLQGQDELGYRVRSIGCPSDLILLGIFNNKAYYRVDYRNVNLICDDDSDRDAIMNRVLSTTVDDLLLDQDVRNVLEG